ncbi:DNA-directed DNA polymerase alpha catalytic subunit pol1 [Xylographa carneopallida]|nr:DNA-directed DNA polymerase alpha catalytic subunit pol1 [Xylographa carneopallida]
MSRSARLAELKALRTSGKTRLSTYKVQEEERLYEEVDEESYKKVVRDRLDRDDFVIDDNGQGYADDGREEWVGEKQYDSVSGSDEELPAKGKAGKRKREEEREKIEKTNNSINRYFNNGPVAAVAKPKPVVTADDAAFMADLLGEVDTNIPSRLPLKIIKTDARKVRLLSPPMENRSSRPSKLKTETELGKLVITPPAELVYDDRNDMTEDFGEDDMVLDNPLQSSPIQKAVERKGHNSTKVEDEDDEMDVAQPIGDKNANTASVNISGSRPPPKLPKPDPSSYPTPESSSPTRPVDDGLDPSTWNDINLKLNVLSSPATLTANPGKLRSQDAIEDDGSLRFFWTDYTEVNGSLCLFGKVKDRSSGGLYVSAFVKVDNILRKLFFLPRVYKQKHGRDTNEEVEMQDVYQEVDELMTRLRVGMHKIKPCSRKYAFELPDIPKEADYLKLMYPHDKPSLPNDLKGESFSNVFGTNTALFEQFVLWKNIMGPCWLTIDADQFSMLNNASWCKFEIQLASPKSIVPLSETEAMDSPPLTIMSIALRTMLNVKENKQEILMASARVYENVSLTDTTPPNKLPCTTFTLMRPSETSFPVGFEAACRKQKGTVILEKSEQLLLSRFLALLEKMDPDVLMGHQLQDVDYPILLSRMRERKTPGWHRIGRLRRSEWPKNIGKGGNSFFAERQLVSGRLLCDIANDMGKSLMTKCQSWSMTEMCELYLSDGNIRQEVDNEVALKTWAATAKGLTNYISHCEADTYFIAAIALRVQMLPLTKVLTNLAGNSWARTLSGTRAERNEYILLHEFHRNKYICPDKIWGKGKQKVEDEVPEGEEGVDVKKKDKFKGGLVFEPEKGLYDKFILVMDFNSLYPSIIQEYNICFTTVERSDQGDDEEKVPEVPSDQHQGVLPRLIATLVSRRREVKKLMKDKRATPEQLATWDIKQLALKLTANSMYGCLGYTQSRFYARPLAMLTTFKGREILRSTKELAESNQLQVIYGDTDSVMINTNANNIEEALKVGNEFKRSVNDRYNLLEIDIDNVFRRLLLHAKKKYAAINLVEVDGKYVDKLEVKGLDMKRREYCALSKDASSRLLNEILSGEDPEVVVGKVHEYLRELARQMREERIPNQKFIIYTKLGKDPRSYPSPDSMPQVQVALRALATGKSVRMNDVISYITTAPTATSSEAAAKRAFAPLDVQKSAGELKPDIEWYLAKQIFPPIERLCAPIDGTDAGQLAECLGLDPKKYALSSAARTESSIQEIAPLESQLPDEIRYKDCPRLQLTCIVCKHKFSFLGITSSVNCVTPKGVICPAEGCGKLFKTITLVAQTEHAIRVLASEYYDGWLVCDDPSCGARTRSMSVYGHRCLGPNGLAHGCLGRMGWEKSGRGVGSTLGFWRGIWDVEKVTIDGAKGVRMEDKERVKALAEWNRERFETIKGVVEGYVKQCGWVWVQMDSLFGFALR